jgi:hypothetical protein
MLLLGSHQIPGGMAMIEEARESSLEFHQLFSRADAVASPRRVDYSDGPLCNGRAIGLKDGLHFVGGWIGDPIQRRDQSVFGRSA